jgi:hypothetical protein
MGFVIFFVLLGILAIETTYLVEGISKKGRRK